MRPWICLVWSHASVMAMLHDRRPNRPGDAYRPAKKLPIGPWQVQIGLREREFQLDSLHQGDGVH